LVAPYIRPFSNINQQARTLLHASVLHSSPGLSAQPVQPVRLAPSLGS
jgi:hypothetical protein